MAIKRETIFTFSISTGVYSDFVKTIVNFTEENWSSYVCFANVHMTMEAYHDKHFNNVINGANLVAPDGKPLCVFLKLFRGVSQERVCGMDIFPDILREAASRNKSIFLYGNTQDVLDKITARARVEFPSIRICGTYSPPFRTLTSDEKADVVKTIKASEADLILVSLGCPRQENWMAEHHGAFKGCMLGLGQAFNVFAGVESRSPRWMQRYALDWLYRLYLNPKRLWKRYLITNSQFLFISVLHRITPKKHHNIGALRN